MLEIELNSIYIGPTDLPLMLWISGGVLEWYLHKYNMAILQHLWKLFSQPISKFHF